MSDRRIQTSTSGSYETEPRKMLHKDRSTVLAVIAGIETEARAREYLGAVNALEQEGENVDTKIKEAILEKVRELS